MEYEIVFDGDVYALALTTRGTADVAGFRASLEEVLADSPWRAGMNVLVDHTHLDVRGLTTDDVREMARLYIERDREIGPGYCGIAVGEPASFGLARMWQAFTDGRLSLRTRIFMRVDDARAWLREVAAPR